jgi:hypothetical protein
VGRAVPLLLIWVFAGILLGDLYLFLCKAIIISSSVRKNTYLVSPSVECVFLALSIAREKQDELPKRNYYNKL